MTMALNQHLTEMITRNNSRGVRLKTLPPSYADCLEFWEPQLLEPSGSVQVCNGIALPLPLYTLSVPTGFEAPASSSGCLIQLKTFYRMYFIINYNDHINISILLTYSTVQSPS